MTFVGTASKVAENTMRSINPALAEKFVTVISFLSKNPDAAPRLRGRSTPAVGSVEYIHRLAQSFADGRSTRLPNPPTTKPDPMVGVILHEYFKIPVQDLERIKAEHLLSMSAENIIGGLLEQYLASAMEPSGWIWCSGSVVRAVDFLRPPSSADSDWRLLQIKNRDNSENSSSSAIRLGTSIEHWFRSFSRREESNWHAFPDVQLKPYLSEEGFVRFVQLYFSPGN